MRRSLSLLALCLLPLGSVYASTPQSDLATLDMKAVEIPVRGGKTVQAERGMLWVPIVRSNPKSKKIGIDVWRFPAQAGSAKDAPPIFRLHGGPGWPGMEPRDVDWGETEPLTRFCDLIIVGQRGIGTSTNTSCAMAVKDLKEGPPEGATELEEMQFLRDRCSDCRTHWESQGYDLKGLNVKEAAADVADVTRLLGYEKIVLWGGSFGSHWGMTIMRYHPDIVARALLTGLEGPNHTYDSPTGILNSLKRMAEAAEAAPQLADFIPEDGLIEAFRLLVEDVAEEAIEMEIENPRTGKEELVVIDARALRNAAQGYRTRVNSRRGMPRWPADIIQLVNGDFEPLAMTLLDDGGVPSLPTASFFMLDCGSGITKERLKELQEDPAINIVGDQSLFYATACEAWDSDLGDDFRSDFSTDIPTVIVHGLWDVNTPFSNALECEPMFNNLSFIPVDGGSHGALGEALRYDKNFESAIMEFLKTGARDNLPNEIQLPPVQWVAPAF